MSNPELSAESALVKPNEEDIAETSVFMPACSGWLADNEEKMPKSRKRKRSRGRHHSSSSQSSSEHRSIGGGRHRNRTIITISRQGSPPKSVAEEMVTKLGGELQPEHKLPKKEIWVRPKPQFLKLLAAVGATGSTFTAKEVLSYLIKYISSRQLYDPLDPKNVFCKADPLGEVFKVSSFTIKDAKRLLFENMTVLHKSPEMPLLPRVQSMPTTKNECYITFRNNQEHPHYMASSPPFPLSHAYRHPTPMGGYSPAAHNDVTTSPPGSISWQTPRPVDCADGPTENDAAQKVLGGRLERLSAGEQGGTDEPDVGIPATTPNMPHPSQESHAQGGGFSDGDRVGCGPPSHRRKKRPKRRHKKRLKCRAVRSRSESSSLTLPSRASRRSSQRSSSLRSSSKRSSNSRGSYHADAATSGGAVVCGRSQPWYCVLYQPGEDVKSQSSEIWSVQGKETAVVTDTSDDLWFMDDDDRFSVEYEVEDSESELESSSDASHATTTEAEIFVEVEDLGSSSDSRFADEDTTDSEIPEEDKWKCSECRQVNNPVHGYCSLCWARRPGWLADEDRKNPSERLGDKHILRRAFSAPAGCHRDSTQQPGSHQGPLIGTTHTHFGSDEAGVGPTRRYPSDTLGRDFPDGKSDDSVKKDSSKAGARSNEERCVLSRMSLPTTSCTATNSMRALQCSPNDTSMPHLYLTTVQEVSEEPVVAETASRDPAPSTTPPRPASANEDRGVGSDSSQKTVGVADTVSRHSSDNSSAPGDSAGPGLLRKRKAFYVSREDSGVCMKRQSSGYSGMDDAGTSAKEGIVGSPTIAASWSNTCDLVQRSPPHGTQHITGGQSLGSLPRSGVVPTPATEGSLVTTTSLLRGSVMTSYPQIKTSEVAGRTSQRASAGGGEGLEGVAPPTAPMVPGIGGGSGSSGPAGELCRICCVRPKTACLIHGRTGHQVCCYRCARKLRRRGKPCPVCRRPIQHIVKNFFA